MYHSKTGVEMLIMHHDVLSRACRHLGAGTSITRDVLGNGSMVCAQWPWGEACWLSMVWSGSKSVLPELFCYCMRPFSFSHSLIMSDLVMPAPEVWWFSSDHGEASPEDKLSQQQLWGSASRGSQLCISCLERSLHAGWKARITW